MENQSKDNPLFVPQRENAGSKTYEKYQYQYHWALYRIIEEHKKEKEYAVFVECHEDVVLADSLNSDLAKFEFNQVKAQNLPITTNSLIKLKNEKSVLGKLIGNSAKFSSRLSSINLISASGFKFKLKDKYVSLQKIGVEDILTEDYSKMLEAIKQELEIDSFPSDLYFVVPELSQTGFQNNLIGAIASLIEDLFPQSNTKAPTIYRLLMDELNKKGVVFYDYKDWDVFLDKKALTFKTVTDVINQFTNVKDDAAIISFFNSIAGEMGLNIIQRDNLRKSFNRYRQQRVGRISSRQIDITSEMLNLLEECVSNGEENISKLIQVVLSNISESTKRFFLNENDIHGAIIFEYIYWRLNEH